MNLRKIVSEALNTFFETKLFFLFFFLCLVLVFFVFFYVVPGRLYSCSDTGYYKYCDLNSCNIIDVILILRITSLLF